MTNRIGGSRMPSGFVVLGVVVLLVFAVIGIQMGRILDSDVESASVVVPLERRNLVEGSTVTLDLPPTSGRIAVTVTPDDLLALRDGDTEAVDGLSMIDDCRSGCTIVIDVVRTAGNTESAALLVDYQAADTDALTGIRPLYD